MAICTLAMVLASSPAAPARSAGRLHSLGVSLDGAVVDARTLAYRLHHGRVLARDTKTGRTTSFDVPQACFVRSVGFGRVLVECGGGAPSDTSDPLLLNLRTGAHRRVAGIRRGDQVAQLGRYWLSGEACLERTHGCNSILFLNWRTGRRVVEPGPATGFDINSPDLRPRHRPRPSTRLAVTRYFDPGRGPGNDLVLLRGRRRTTLSKCPASCQDPQLSDGLVTWRENKTAHAYVLHSDRRLSWSFPAADHITVRHSAYEIVIAASTDDATNAAKLLVAGWR